MSFRKFGGMNYASKHNAVSSNYNSINNLLVNENFGQPGSYVNFESDISGNIKIYGNVDISGNTNIYGELDVSGNTNIQSDLDVSGNLNIQGVLDVSGNVSFYSDLDVKGNANIQGNLDVSGNTNIQSDLDVSGNTNLEGTLSVSGNITASSQLSVTGQPQTWFMNSSFLDQTNETTYGSSNIGLYWDWTVCFGGASASNWNNTTGIFTASENGLYLIQATFYINYVSYSSSGYSAIIPFGTSVTNRYPFLPSTSTTTSSSKVCPSLMIYMETNETFYWFAFYDIELIYGAGWGLTTMQIIKIY